MPGCTICHRGETSCQSSLKHERWSIHLSPLDPLWPKSTSLFLPCDEPRFLLESNTLKFPRGRKLSFVCFGMPQGDLNGFCRNTAKCRIHLTWWAAPNMWGHLISDEQTAAGRIVSLWAMHALGNQASLALIRNKMRANRVIRQNPSSHQDLLILLPACTKSLIDERFQLCSGQLLHTLRLGFGAVSTLLTGMEKGN